MGIQGWPWTDTLSIQTNTPNKCGFITYEIIPLSFSPNDLVSFEDFADDSLDYLLFAPQLTHPAGSYYLALRGSLIYNGLVVDYLDEEFEVFVDPCQSALDLSLVQLPSMENLWYAESRLYDISYILGQVIPSYDCGYTYVFELFVVLYDENGNETGISQTLPVEIDFYINLDDQVITLNLSKCFPIGQDSPVDPMCNDFTIPHQLDWTLRLKISLPAVGGGDFGFLDFPARILDPCLVDTVSMVNLPSMTTPIPYTVFAVDPAVITYEVGVSQQYELCPLTCDIFETSLTTAPAFVSTFTVLNSPSDLHPSLKSQQVVLQI